MDWSILLSFANFSGKIVFTAFTAKNGNSQKILVLSPPILKF